MIPVGETYFGPNYRLGGDQGLWGICQAMSMALSLCLVEKKKKKGPQPSVFSRVSTYIGWLGT